MGKESYLFAANIIVWVGIACYVVFLAATQKRLEKRLKRLEMSHDD